MIHRPQSADEIAELVRGQGPPLLPRGGGTKPALCSPVHASAPDEPDGPRAQILDMTAFSGILAYEPSEFTISVRAGTPLSEITSKLEVNGQALPFDPPWIEAGATAGGTLAAGLSGPGRLRGGGVRDAVLAVRFVDGRGRHARAGAPVVKNAAGFDLPKLFTGSLGRLAVLTEVTFKVLPAPRSYLTGFFRFPSLDEARRAALSLLGSSLSLDGLEIDREKGGRWRLAIRLGGEPSKLEKRLERVADHLGRGASSLADDDAFWRSRRDVDWAEQEALVWVPVGVHRVLRLDEALRDFEHAEAHYAGGLSHAWLTLPAAGLSALDAVLSQLDLPGLLIRPGTRPPVLGHKPEESFLRRIQEALDPAGRFLSF